MCSLCVQVHGYLVLNLPNPPLPMADVGSLQAKTETAAMLAEALKGTKKLLITIDSKQTMRTGRKEVSLAY